jgi:glycosyltransferase involved in cell wall biosynthesis
MSQVEIPEVSVVMGVYNAADSLRATLASILDQSGCRLEFIVIDDGSTDGTPAILEEHAARDPRLRVIHQENSGLTRALIRGCQEAQADLIARQDAGDLSLPGRLQQQAVFLNSHPEAVMCACAVQVSGPRGEPLYTQARVALELDRGLRKTGIESVRGPPHHGGTMFRRSAYLQAGGYRAQFAVAQDLDLWLRLIELGQCLGMEDVLYAARLEAGSISSRRRGEQLRMATLALACASARRACGDDSSLLTNVRASPATSRAISRVEKARFNYFIASCLRSRYPELARLYYRQALRENPLHLKALLGWMTGYETTRI